MWAGAGTAAAAPCQDSLVTSKPFLDAVRAAGIEYDRNMEPTERPAKDLEFLDLAEEAGFEGTVFVMLLVAATGDVADRVVVCAEPYGYFEAGVLDWTKGFKFAPLPSGTPDHYRAFVVRASFRIR